MRPKISSSTGEPEVVNEHLKVSDTGRSIEEDPVVGGLSEASVSHGTVDVLGDEAGVSVLLDEQPVTMDKVESEEMFYLGKIEIGVCAGEPDIAKEREVSDTGRSIEENPVVGGLSEVSVVTIMAIIAGDDVKAKDMGKSGDFQVGDAIRDDSVVSIMSMGYEGCCFQEESMETQRQGHGAVDLATIATMVMVVMCQVINSNMAYRRSRPVGLECLWTPDGLLGYYLEAELGLGHSYEFVIEKSL